MEYRVEITARAERDLAGIYTHIDAERSDSALRWYRGLKEAVLSLETLPNRCAIAPERRSLRHLLYGAKPHVYRVIYRVFEKQKRVEVLHIRHGARDELQEPDVR